MSNIECSAKIARHENLLTITRSDVQAITHKIFIFKDDKWKIDTYRTVEYSSKNDHK